MDNFFLILITCRVKKVHSDLYELPQWTWNANDARFTPRKRILAKILQKIYYQGKLFGAIEIFHG